MYQGFAARSSKPGRKQEENLNCVIWGELNIHAHLPRCEDSEGTSKMQCS